MKDTEEQLDEIQSSDSQSPEDMSPLTYDVIGAAQKVHRTLGPGFTESVYQAALVKELMLRKIAFQSQQEFHVVYEQTLCGTYRADIVVGNAVILELKAVSSVCPEHKAQLVSYLKASGLPTGLLLNFGATSLQIRRYSLRSLKQSL